MLGRLLQPQRLCLLLLLLLLLLRSFLLQRLLPGS
jgi:hypothetical protein